MDAIDSLALWGRRFERQTVPGSHEGRFGLGDLLAMFDRNLILQLTPIINGKELATVRPDSVRKLKVSLLDDGVSAMQPATEWYEVFRTPPSGDLSKVRIVAHGSDGAVKGEIRMLVGRRSYDHYFEQDPILEHLRRNVANNRASRRHRD